MKVTSWGAVSPPPVSPFRNAVEVKQPNCTTPSISTQPYGRYIHLIPHPTYHLPRGTYNPYHHAYMTPYYGLTHMDTLPPPILPSNSTIPTTPPPRLGPCCPVFGSTVCGRTVRGSTSARLCTVLCKTLSDTVSYTAFRNEGSEMSRVTAVRETNWADAGCVEAGDSGSFGDTGRGDVARGREQGRPRVDRLLSRPPCGLHCTLVRVWGGACMKRR
ncbi:hypothetical protein EDC01DRAFT_641056 [Geopyxis carbonaria]|nr:hypothetical protein EDC01DRAFT_641056 [Geopyxis carbonaria]